MASWLSLSGIEWWGNDDRHGYFLTLVLMVELPATTLLYWHLRSLAEPDPTAKAGLTLCAVTVPVLMAMAVPMLLLDLQQWRDLPAVTQFLLAGGYGAAAMTCTLVSFGCLARLSVVYGRRAVIDVSPLVECMTAGLRWLIDAVRAHAVTLALFLGCAVWLYATWQSLGSLAWMPRRASVLGDLPFFNFLGPKVLGDYIARFSYVSGGSYRTSSVVRNTPLLLMTLDLLAIWLMTTTSAPGVWPRRLATMVRWYPTLLVGAFMAIGLAIGPLTNDANAVLSRQSKFMLLLIASIELPTTLLLYLHLAFLADHAKQRKVAHGLLLSGAAAALLMAASLSVALLTDVSKRVWLEWQDTPTWFVAAAVLGAAVMTTSFYATWQVLRLMATLIRKPAV